MSAAPPINTEYCRRQRLGYSNHFGQTVALESVPLGELYCKGVYFNIPKVQVRDRR